MKLRAEELDLCNFLAVMGVGLNKDQEVMFKEIFRDGEAKINTEGEHEHED